MDGHSNCKRTFRCECRTADGRLDDEKAAAILALPQVKMVEIKLAQGAKPGKGGVLPKEKITAEIAAIRGIPMGEDCHSPNCVRVRNYAIALERDLQMITHACGLTHPSQLHRGHVVMNISPGVRKALVELFPYPRSPVEQGRSATAGTERVERDAAYAVARSHGAGRPAFHRSASAARASARCWSPLD
jgi:hypothetical protein